MRSIKGFTLVEMMIALAIAAGVAVISYRALDGAIRADDKVVQVVQSVNEIDRVWQYLSRDLLYVLPRPWKSPTGEVRPALWGAFGDRLSQSDVMVADEQSYLLLLLRGGRDRLAYQGSDLHLVGYRLTAMADQGDAAEPQLALWRDLWAPVDGSAEPQMQQRLLLEGIKSLGFRYLSKTGDWSTGWPGPGVPQDRLPVVVEIKMNVVGWGELVRVFDVTAER